MKIKIRNASDILITYYIIYLLLGCIFITTLLQSQTIKQQAEQQLEKMSSSEIDAKIKEFGMTKEEAIKRARSQGIDIESYISSLSVQASKAEAQKSEPHISPMVKVSAPLQLENIEKPPTASGTFIAGFEGRTQVIGLEPYGYSIFHYPATTFEPVLNIPTPPNYIVGPGDEIIISVWGDTKLYHSLIINREGNLVVPDVGPINVNGLTIKQMNDKLLRRMTEVYASLKYSQRGPTSFLDVSLGKLRTIHVFVLGEVTKPGGYSLSSLSTMLHALYLSGGPTTNGTLRTINLLRDNKIVSQLDFYDYALKGIKTSDIRLQDGDILFVPPVKKRVALVGSIIRPSIYELKDKETFCDLLTFSGGLIASAYTDRIHIERLVPFAQRQFLKKDIIDIDVYFNSVKELEVSSLPLEDADIISIFSITNYPLNRVTITGNVNKPGTFGFTEGMRVADLIMRADSFARNTFMEKATLLRLLPNLRKEIIQFNPIKALTGDIGENILLKNEDQIVIYKESDFFPERHVFIYGAVKKPGKYPRYEKMSAADLVVLAGGLKEEGSFDNWELSHIDTTNVEKYSIIKRFNVHSEYWSDTLLSSIQLQDFDCINVPYNPKFTYAKNVVVSGYAMMPGTYTVRNIDEKVYDILKRAGGPRPEAYLPGARLYRNANGSIKLMSVELEEIWKNPRSAENISVMDGDSLFIPYNTNVVNIIGEVFTPAAVLYEKNASLKYYLEQAGGLKEEADDNKIFVILPNGKAWKKSWFIFPDPDILPGSTIHVPKKIEKEDKTLPILRDWATITLSIATMMVAIVQVTK